MDKEFCVQCGKIITRKVKFNKGFGVRQAYHPSCYKKMLGGFWTEPKSKVVDIDKYEAFYETITGVIEKKKIGTNTIILEGIRFGSMSSTEGDNWEYFNVRVIYEPINTEVFAVRHISLRKAMKIYKDKIKEYKERLKIKKKPIVEKVVKKTIGGKQYILVKCFSSETDALNAAIATSFKNEGWKSIIKSVGGRHCVYKRKI